MRTLSSTDNCYLDLFNASFSGHAHKVDSIDGQDVVSHVEQA